jgi:hypothetical protein
MHWLRAIAPRWASVCALWLATASICGCDAGASAGGGDDGLEPRARAAKDKASESTDASAPLRALFAPMDGGMPLGIVEDFEPRRWSLPAPPPPPRAPDAGAMLEAIDEDAGMEAVLEPPPPPSHVPPPPGSGSDDDGGTVDPPVLAPKPFVNAVFELGLGAYRADTGENGERHGPGGAFVDLDGDAYPELVLGTGDGSPNMLYRNVEGPGGTRRFVGEPLGGGVGGGVGAVAGDYDNDGDLDVFVANYDDDDVLYRNTLVEDGTLALVDVTDASDPTPENATDEQMGLRAAKLDGYVMDLSMSAAWGDVDRDGLLDLYVGTHNGHGQFPDEGLVPGQRNTLYLNNGDGTFTDVTEQAGVEGFETGGGAHTTSKQSYASTNAVHFMDMNGDPWPDLLVTNKTNVSTDKDMWYLNRGDDAEGNWLGFELISYRLAGSSFLGTLTMGIASGDIDNDGDLDLAATDLPDPRVMVNEGLATDIPELARIDCCRAGFSWGVALEDFDRDGLLDVHVSTNSSRNDHFYLGPIGGTSNEAAEMGLNQRRQSRGTMVADYDRDGWPDLFVVNLSGSSAMFHNEMADFIDPTTHRFLALRLEGDPSLPGDYRSSRDAIGARIFVTADVAGEGPVTMRRDLQSGRGNATSSSSMWVRFGLGQASSADVTIQWPSGRMTTLDDVAADSFVEVLETE